jgi:hypothetical protein
VKLRTNISVSPNSGGNGNINLVQKAEVIDAGRKD